MRNAKVLGLIVLIAAAIAGVIAFRYRAVIRYQVARLPGVGQVLKKATADDQATKYGAIARSRLQPMFAAKGVNYPPGHLALVAIKDSSQLQLYAAEGGGRYKLINTYPILGASGHLGPKLREGDLQVPEGVYNIYALEPNTPYHLGLRVNYPNDFDLRHAREDGRTEPGSDILIHGSTGSVGCLAMGDAVSEDLFIAAFDCPDKQLPLVISPVDFRTGATAPHRDDSPAWLDELYSSIQSALQKYPTQ